MFHRPLRACTAGLWLAGAALAGGSAIPALSRLGIGQALVFTAVAVVAAVLSLAVLRAARWALWVSTFALGGQVGAVLGTASELAVGINPGKATQLRQLGVDPTAGVLINLAYSGLASLLFFWLSWRWLRHRANRLPRP